MRDRLVSLRRTLGDWLREGRIHRRDFGAASAATLALSRLLGRGRPPQARPPLWPLRPPGFAHPAYYREGTSDSLVLRQVLGRREYACVGDLDNVETVFDLGGNVGATSLYLLHRYPRARVIFVEPDAGNLRVARRTLAPWAGQVTFVQAGVWDDSVGLRVERGSYRDGREWSIQVRPVRPGEAPDLLGVTVNDLVALCGVTRIDVLKMDIEAAEATVLRGDVSWLKITRAMAVELHGPDCAAALDAALAGYDCERSESGELTVVRDIRPRAASA